MLLAMEKCGLRGVLRFSGVFATATITRGYTWAAGSQAPGDYKELTLTRIATRIKDGDLLIRGVLCPERMTRVESYFLQFLSF